MAGKQVMHHTDGCWNCIWSDFFIEYTYMANDVAELDNNQDQHHVAMRHKEERPRWMQSSIQTEGRSTSSLADHAT